MLRYIETLFRLKWRILLPALALLVAAEATTYLLLPREYQSNAIVWVDRPAFFNELNNPYNLSPYQTVADNQATTMQELLKTNAFADDVFQRAGWDDHGSASVHESMLSRIRKDISISATGVHLIRISFKSENSQEPQSVVQAMLDSYATYSNASSQQQAESAIQFYQAQVKSLGEIYNTSTQKLAQYLDAHPELRDRNNAPNDPTYTQLTQQNSFDRDQYERAQQQLDQSRASSGAVEQAKPTTFKVMDAPGPVKATAGSSQRLLQYGLGLGLMLAYAALTVIFSTWADPTIRSRQDVEHLLNVPLLTTLEYNPSMAGAITAGPGGTPSSDRKAPKRVGFGKATQVD